MSFSTRTLAYMLDSLVRVSRRDGKNHFDKIIVIPQVSSALSGIAFFGTSNLILSVTLIQPLQVLPASTIHSNRQRLPLTSQRFQIFSLSFQSPFHLSFTVLVCYRSPIHIQLWKNRISLLGLQFQATRLFCDPPYSAEVFTGLLPSLAHFPK